MRGTIINGKDREFIYDLGADIDTLCAVIEHPKTRQPEYIIYELLLTGAELIDFIKQHASYAEKIIPNIDPEGHYELTGFDD